MTGDFRAARGDGARPGLARAALGGLLVLLSPAAGAFTPPAELVLVTDDNYPPYLFRAEDGKLQGILKDRWELWSRTTGVPVTVKGMEWAKATTPREEAAA